MSELENKDAETTLEPDDSAPAASPVAEADVNQVDTDETNEATDEHADDEAGAIDAVDAPETAEDDSVTIDADALVQDASVESTVEADENVDGLSLPEEDEKVTVADGDADAGESLDSADAPETAEAVQDAAPDTAEPIAPATPRTTGSLPGFLTREEYVKVGDDPEPLPKNFEVLDGGIGANGTAIPVSSETTENGGDAKPAPSGPTAAESMSAAAKAVGAFLQEGVTSVREMNAARRAHADAREALEQLENTIKTQKAELEHRRDITSRHAEILKEETARINAAAQAKAQAEAAQAEIAKQVDALKEQLQQIKDADAATEKRLKAALDAAEAKQETARESGSRLQRRLDDAERNLKKAQEERAAGISATQNTIENAQTRLATLREEFAEVQRNPSANSAEYSVRSGELEAQISDAVEALRVAREELPRVTAEYDRAIASAQAIVAEASKPIDAAKQAFGSVRGEADKARDAFEAAQKEAEAHQKELHRRIQEQEKAAKEHDRTIADAQKETEAAQTTLDEANDIYSHPEITEAIAHAVAADQAELDERQAEVSALAAVEQDVRDRTRGSRIKFLGAVGVVALVVLLFVIWTFVVPK